MLINCIGVWQGLSCSRNAKSSTEKTAKIIAIDYEKWEIQGEKKSHQAKYIILFV